MLIGINDLRYSCAYVVFISHFPVLILSISALWNLVVTPKGSKWYWYNREWTIFLALCRFFSFEHCDKHCTNINLLIRINTKSKDILQSYRRWMVFPGSSPLLSCLLLRLRIWCQFLRSRVYWRDILLSLPAQHTHQSQVSDQVLSLHSLLHSPIWSNDNIMSKLVTRLRMPIVQWFLKIHKIFIYNQHVSISRLPIVDHGTWKQVNNVIDGTFTTCTNGITFFM